MKVRFANERLFLRNTKIQFAYVPGKIVLGLLRLLRFVSAT